MQSISEVKTVPDGYHSVNLFLIVEGAEKLIQFLKQTFGGKVEESVIGPDGRIAHAELTVGDSIIMMADATPKYGATSVHLYVYLENVDLPFKRALEAGASSIQEPADQFYGDRTAGVHGPDRKLLVDSPARGRPLPGRIGTTHQGTLPADDCLDLVVLMLDHSGLLLL